MTRVKKEDKVVFRSKHSLSSSYISYTAIDRGTHTEFVLAILASKI